MEYRFESFQLSTVERELRRDGERVHVQPLVFEVLVYLLLHRDRVVTRQELLENVWGGVAVSGAAVASAIRDARIATGDDGRQQRIIRTVPKLGFRFVCSAQEEDGPSGSRSNDERACNPSPGERRRCEALIELGQRLCRAGRYHQGGRELLLRAAFLARRGGWMELLTRAVLEVGDPAHGLAAGDELLPALLRDALDALDPRHEVLRLQLSSRLAAERTGDARGSGPMSAAEALAAAREGGNASTLAGALLAQIMQLAGPSHLAQRRVYATELVEVGLSAGDATLESWGHHFLTSCAIEAGEARELDRAAEAFARAAERTSGSPHLELLVGLEAGRAAWEGRFETALGLVERLSLLERESPLTLLSVNVQVLQLLVPCLRGDPVPVRRCAALADAPLPEEYTIVARAIGAWAAFESGSRDWAQDAYQRFADEDVPDNMYTLAVLFIMGELAAAFGDASRIPALAARLRPLADRVAAATGMHYLGSIWRPLGNLARAEGNGAEAVRLLRRGVETEREMRAAPVEARVRLDLARALEETGRFEEASSEVAACLRVADRLGMRRLASRASRIAARLASQGQATRPRGPRPTPTV